MKKIIKYVLSSNLLYLHYIRLSIVQKKINSFINMNIAKSIDDSLVVIGERELISRLANVKFSNVCHVIGSGWSLNDTINSIPQSDYSFGCNYSALCLALNFQFDLHFFEFGGPLYSDTVKDHKALASIIKEDGNTIVAFKNIWSNKNSIKSSVFNWSDKAYFVHDILPHCIVSEDEKLEELLRIMIESKDDFIYQLGSTVVTNIVLAYKLGCKKIVLHGVDFGGDYFYQSNEKIVSSFSWLNVFSEKPNENTAYTNEPQKSHATNNGNVTLSHIIICLSNVLERKGVTLYSASKSSPLSKILPVI